MAGKRLIAMQCGERDLGHLSLVFGLLAVGTLSLSVATDFWLFTTEELDASLLVGDMTKSLPPMPSDYNEVNTSSLSSLEMEEDIGSEMDMDMEYLLPGDSGVFPIVIANTHSGLWRSCMYYDQGQEHWFTRRFASIRDTRKLQETFLFLD